MVNVLTGSEDWACINMMVPHNQDYMTFALSVWRICSPANDTFVICVDPVTN